MAKLRVYEYAKQLNMSSKEILTILNRLDVPVANHMSVMEPEMVSKVEKFFSDVKQKAAIKHASEVERELREKQRQRERAGTHPGGRDTAAVESGGRAWPAERGSTASSAHVNFANDQGGREATDAARSGSAAGKTARGSEARSEREAATAGEDSMKGNTKTGTGSEVPSAQTEKHNQGMNTGTGDAPESGGHRTNAGPRSGGNGDRNRSRGGYGGQQRSGGYGGGQGGGQRSGGYGGGQRSGGYGSGQGGGQRSGGYGGGQQRSGGYGGGQGGGQRSGGYGGGQQRSGGYGGGQGSGQRSGGYGGGQRSGGYGGQGGGGQRSGGYGGGRGGHGGGRPGGGRPGGGRPAAAPMSVTAKPVSPASKAKEKEKERERSRNDFSRDRREQFNEDKLVRSGKRRGGQSEERKPEFPTSITVEGPMTVGDFAKLLKREPSEIIKKLLFLGIMATINQEIDTDAMELVASEFNVEMTVVEPVDEEALDMLVEEDKPEDLVPRPPVVTIMGHVDHGKTTLLDAIRSSRVTATESGGITQHIGAYQVVVQDRRITFLDTPGHEAFTTMRARGAQVTDVTILVVAADDGVMPQTVEAINHAKAANVPIIVAVNKIDKPGANPDRVKQELTQHGLVAEEWGGDTIFVNISALKKEGLDSLLEMVLLVADLQELKANPKARPRGTVIEAKLDKGRGTVATVLVQNGTLRVGDIVVAGQTYGRVRAMMNDVGKRIKEAPPSTPVEILGLNELPSAGDLFVVYDDERSARNLAQKRQNREKVQQQQNTARVTLDDLYRQIQEGNVKELNVIVKADVQGSVEALVQAIEKIEVEGVRVNVIHRGAGAINESDVLLASTSNAIIIGFHVRPDANAARAAEAEKVDIRLYRVIYNVIEELESAMKGMLDPTYKEVVIGHAEVRQTFHISRVGTVAGCYVTDGKLTRDAECRVIRDGVVVYEGRLDTLKRFKDDVREVAQGFECGLTLDKYNDIKVGDVVEAFQMEAVKPE
ncbi:hypothetical protein GCM10025857_03500 [Alicyclobacillus contaminans]|nr:hypothetical protein GCM10025857_03500 [Alicyclobacillus contaminans]